ncbi:radical SAM protein [bacterium]|nr:radical SAM protein [bacterium]
MELPEFSEFKIINHLDRVQAVLRGELAPPVTLEIDPTNVCNHDCVWCIDIDNRTTYNTHLKRKAIFDVLTEARELGVESIVFKGGGEPMIYPRFDGLLRHAKDLGFEIGVITNGEKIIDYADALAETCAWLRVSLDAGSAETHRRVHQPKRARAYERIWEGIDAVSRRVYVGVIYIIHPVTYHEMTVAAQRAKETGCRYIGFKRVVADAELFDAEQYMAIEANYLVAKKDLEDASFGVMGFRIYNFSKGPNATPYDLCLGHHLIGILCANGEMYACCSTRGNPAFSFGSVYESSLTEIWHGEKRREVLARINAKTCRHICVGHTSYMRYDHYNDLFSYLARGEKPHGKFL